MNITDLEMFCHKPVCVFHSADPDGVYSAWVCDYYYHNAYITRKCNSVPEYVPINYSDTIDIVNYNRLKDASIIFMSDITLADKYMDEFAEKIVWLDHHFSALERAKTKEWGKRLYYNGSKVGTAGCKLTWNYFFENEQPVPYFIEYAALYDVWEKSNIEVDYFCCYNNKHLVFGTNELRRGNCEALKNNFAWINSEVVDNRMNVLIEGKNLFTAQEEENERQCKVMAHYGELLGHRIAIANFNRCNSDWFKWIVKKHPDIEYLLTFDYKFPTKTWRVSAYNSSTNIGGDALAFLNSLADFSREDIVSIGGHKAACGMVCKNVEKLVLSHVS